MESGRRRGGSEAGAARPDSPLPAMALPGSLLLLLALGPCAGRASDVLELGDSDFESGLAERPGLVLVEFYAPW